MSRLLAAWRQYRARRARRCCAGRCTTADDARLLAQLPPVYIPRQRPTEES